MPKVCPAGIAARLSIPASAFCAVFGAAMHASTHDKHGMCCIFVLTRRAGRMLRALLRHNWLPLHQGNNRGRVGGVSPNRVLHASHRIFGALSHL